jgi:cell wall-associated NlpC family hydrolase
MYFKYYLNRYKFHFIAIFIILIAIPFCTIKKEPEKVWNLRGKLVSLTKHLKGLPYRYGGFDLEGFDCSGLVYYVYDSFGIRVPRTAKKQAKLKRKVRLSQVEPGDILAFKFKRRWHTAIYIGNKEFIHAPNSRGVVRQEFLTPAWKKRLKKIIRLIEE